MSGQKNTSDRIAHLPAAGEEETGDVGITIEARQVEGGVAFIVPHVHIRSLFDEEAYSVDVALRARTVQRGGATLGFCIDLRPFFQEKADDVGVAQKKVEGGVAGPATRVHIRPVVQEEPDDIVGPRQVQRRLFILVPRVHLGPVVQQQPDDIGEPLQTRLGAVCQCLSSRSHLPRPR